MHNITYIKNRGTHGDSSNNYSSSAKSQSIRLVKREPTAEFDLGGSHHLYRWWRMSPKEEFRSLYSEESYSEMTKQKNVKHHIGDEVIRHGIPHICVNDEFCRGIDHRLEKKDRYVWEQVNGSIHENHMIIHLDNDPMNCDLENLRCIPTRFRTFLAKNRWWDASPDMKEAILKWCELFYALQDAKQNAEP